MLLLINIYMVFCYIGLMKTELNNQLKIIGSNLRLARKCQNLSMQQVADATGLCRQTISDAENGHGKIGLETYLQIADAVGVDLSSNVLPQILRRSTRRVNMLDHCQGETREGVPFTFHESHHTSVISFHYHGQEYEIPFEQNPSPTTTRAKPLYYFSAASAVSAATRKIDFTEDVRKVMDHTSERNIRPQT